MIWISFEQEGPSDDRVVLIIGRNSKDKKTKKRYHWGLGFMKNGKLNIISPTLVPGEGAEYDPICWAKLPTPTICVNYAIDKYSSQCGAFSILMDDLLFFEREKEYINRAKDKKN
jgi:hypothetical protein